jgi:flagellar basal-body rod protein FlgC
MPVSVSPAFAGLATPASGMNTYRTWMNAISDNVANAMTPRRTNEAAFQERFVVVQSREEGGVEVSAIRYGDPAGRLTYDPTHALADENGLVRMPDVNLSDQMVHLIAAQRAYQMNVAVFERARDGYQRALEIGK